MKGRDKTRVAFLGGVVIVFAGIAYRDSRPKQPAGSPAMQTMRAYLAAPDMGIHCFDDHGQPVGWQWVNLDDAQRSCGITPSRLMELKTTNWQAVASAKNASSALLATVAGTLAWCLVGAWLWRMKRGSSARMQDVCLDSGSSEFAKEFWMERNTSDRGWLRAWLLGTPGVLLLFLLPDAWRVRVFVSAAVCGLGWLVIRGGRWLYDAIEDASYTRQQQKVETFMAEQSAKWGPDMRPRLATGRAVTSEQEKKALGMKGKKLSDL